MKVKLTTLFFLFLIATAFVQNDVDFIRALTQKIQEYKLRKPHVKVFLFFNQNVYASGDTAYFSAHFISEEMNPIGGRQILRVELMDQSGRLVFFENFATKEGKGYNQVAIPTGLKAGIYQWVAYSDWMKNFDPEFYFRQDFLLVEKNDWITATTNDQIDLTFYPEGGTLVSTIPNKVVVKSSSNSPSPVRIMDEAGNEIAQFTLNKNGLGYFRFTPVATSTYYAEVHHLDKIVRANLPAISSDGISMIMSALNDPVKVDVRVSRASKYRKSDLWLVVSARAEVYFSAPVRFDDRELITVQFPTKELPPGICFATLFNEQGIVLAERLFMIHPKPEVNTTVTKIGQTFDTRSTVDLKVSLKDSLGNPLSGEFAISVFDKQFFNKQLGALQIDQYMYLNSEIPDNNGNRNYLPEELDLLLITQKNKRLDWKEILEGKLEPISSFKRLIQYSGSIVSKEGGQPLPEARLSAYLQKSMMGYEAISKADGSFDLVFLFDFWNEDEIFYTIEDKNGNAANAKVIWKMDSSSGVSLTPMIESTTANKYADFASRKKLMDKSYSFYGNSEVLNTSLSENPNWDFEDELTGVDYSVKVDEYVVFPTMEELIREVVPSLLHRRVKGKSIVRVVLPDGAIPNEDPLFIIDGIMTKNTEYFLRLKPVDIITIKVVKTINKLNRFGTMGRSGIVLVQTKGIDQKALKIENTMISVKGLNKPIPFQIPTYSGSLDQRIPDFRSTLYWNPSVTTNSKGEGSINFSASDDVGVFFIQIQGITSDGRPFSKLDSIQLVFNRN